MGGALEAEGGVLGVVDGVGRRPRGARGGGLRGGGGVGCGGGLGMVLLSH
jgi:hypothetical protein